MSRFLTKLLGKEGTKGKGRQTHASKLADLPDAELEGDSIFYRETAHHGLPAHGTACAYDGTQGLLAVGTKDGAAKLFGSRGVERLLTPPGQEAPVCCMHFAQGLGYLAVATTLPALYVWDLRQESGQEKCTRVTLHGFVVSLDAAVGSGYLTIGTSRTEVRFLKFGQRTLSKYLVGANDLNFGKEACDIVAAPSHPRGALRLLVAARVGYLIIWDMRLRSVVKRFVGAGTGSSLEQACWSPDASRVVSTVCSYDCDVITTKHNQAAGYANGCLLLWAADSDKSVLMTLEPSAADLSVLRMEWKYFGEVNAAGSGRYSRDKGPGGSAGGQNRSALIVLLVREEIEPTGAEDWKGRGEIVMYTGVGCQVKERITFSDLVLAGSSHAPVLGTMGDDGGVGAHAKVVSMAVCALTRRTTPAVILLLSEHGRLDGIPVALERGAGEREDRGLKLRLPPHSLGKELGNVLAAAPVTCLYHATSVPVSLMHSLLHDEHPHNDDFQWELVDEGARKPTSVMDPMFGGQRPEAPLTSPAPALLVTGHADGQVRVWDVRTESLQELPGAHVQRALGLLDREVTLFQDNPSEDAARQRGFGESKALACSLLLLVDESGEGGGQKRRLYLLLMCAKRVELLRLETEGGRVKNVASRSVPLRQCTEGRCDGQVHTIYFEDAGEDVDNAACGREDVCADIHANPPDPLDTPTSSWVGDSEVPEQAAAHEHLEQLGVDILLGRPCPSLPPTRSPPPRPVISFDMSSDGCAGVVSEEAGIQDEEETELPDLSFLDADASPKSQDAIYGIEEGAMSRTCLDGESCTSAKKEVKNSSLSPKPSTKNRQEEADSGKHVICCVSGFVPLAVVSREPLVASECAITAVQDSARVRCATAISGQEGKAGVLIVGWSDGYVTSVSCGASGASDSVIPPLVQGNGVGVSAIACGWIGVDRLLGVFVADDSGCVFVYHLHTGARLPMAIQPRTADTRTTSNASYIHLALLDRNGTPVDADSQQGMTDGGGGQARVAQYLLTVTSKHVALFSLPLPLEAEPLVQTALKITATHAALVHSQGEPCVCCWEPSGAMQVFSLLRLRAMATILLQDAHTLLPSNALQTIAVGSDGRTMLAAPLPGCGDGSEGGWALMRGSIFCDENALRQPHVSVSLHRHEIPAPLHPSKAEGDDREAGAGGGVGLLGGLMSKLKDGLQKDDMNVLESILCVCEATEEEREGAHGKTIDEQERSRQDRRLLLAGGKRSIDKGSDVGDAAAATDTRGLAAKSGAAGAAVTAQEAVNRLHERGEKLNLLHEKADRLQGRAQEFHDMIRKHNQREAAKKWWQL